MSGQYGSYPNQPYDENFAGGYSSYGAPTTYGAPQQQRIRPWASWGSRAGARIIDSLLSTVMALVPMVPGLILAFHGAHEVEQYDGTNELEGVNPLGFVFVGLGLLAALIFSCWNLGIRQGKTGQSIGKKMLHIEVIDENTGAPAGAGAGFGRYAVELLFSAVNSCIGVLSLLDILWPLWDTKNQALHDKVVHTVVVQENA